MTRNVDARGCEVHGGGVPEGVWRYMLGTTLWHGFSRRLHVGGELEPAPEALSGYHSFDEQPLVGRPWLPFKQYSQQHHAVVEKRQRLSDASFPKNWEQRVVHRGTGGKFLIKTREYRRCFPLAWGMSDVVAEEAH